MHQHSRISIIPLFKVCRIWNPHKSLLNDRLSIKSVQIWITDCHALWPLTNRFAFFWRSFNSYQLLDGRIFEWIWERRCVRSIYAFTLFSSSRNVQILLQWVQSLTIHDLHWTEKVPFLCVLAAEYQIFDWRLYSWLQLLAHFKIPPSHLEPNSSLAEMNHLLPWTIVPKHRIIYYAKMTGPAVATSFWMTKSGMPLWFLVDRVVWCPYFISLSPTYLSTKTLPKTPQLQNLKTPRHFSALRSESKRTSITSVALWPT